MAMEAPNSGSTWRIFGASAIITVGVLAGVLIGAGGNAALVTLVLVAIEVAFSFDNAIINAKTLSPKWQRGVCRRRSSRALVESKATLPKISLRLVGLAIIRCDLSRR